MALDRRKSDIAPTLSQADTLRILEARNNAAREELAARSDAAPEVLFFLASEGSIKARRAVAQNPAAPPHANRLLAEDGDDDQDERDVGRREDAVGEQLEVDQRVAARAQRVHDEQGEHRHAHEHRHEHLGRDDRALPGDRGDAVEEQRQAR